MNKNSGQNDHQKYGQNQNHNRDPEDEIPSDSSSVEFNSGFNLDFSPKFSLEFNNVFKSYGQNQALRGLSLKARPGEKLAVIGCNGAGKSTFLSIAAGLRRADRGEVKVLGRDPREKIVKSQLRILPQDLSFPETLTVKDILKTVYAHANDTSWISNLEKLRMTNFFHRKTSDLSGGERRKVGLACSLYGRPKLVLLDEPTANIDLIGKDLIHQWLKEEFSSTDKTLIFSSHEVQEVELLADRVAVFKDGAIVADGPSYEIKSRFGLKKVKFIGSSKDIDFKSVQKVYKEKEFTVLMGANSDEMIYELIQREPKAQRIAIEQPSLEEVILQILEGRV